MRLNQGAYLPGFGGGDRIKALLEAGEYVSDKFTVRYFGADFFRGLKEMARSGMRMPSLPGLPSMPSPPVGLNGGGAAAAPVQLNVTFAGDVSPMGRSTANNNAKLLMGELQKIHRRMSS